MYDASYFQDKPKTVYSGKKQFIPIPKGPHNEHLIQSAENNVRENKKHPTELDKQMMQFLKNHGIHYEYQKPIYIKSEGGFIKQYFIVDFWFPTRNIIMEVRPSKPTVPYKSDNSRETIIKKAYPTYAIIYWYGSDFQSYTKMKQLISLLKPQRAEQPNVYKEDVK